MFDKGSQKRDVFINVSGELTPVKFHLSPSAIQPFKQPVPHCHKEAVKAPAIEGNPIIVIVSPKLDV